MEPSALPPASASEHLEKVLASNAFRSAGRSSRLLRFLVENALTGKADRLKEYTIGAEALERGESFDPRFDSIARAEVSRLRERLERYYASEGRGDALIILLPKGSYVPGFEARNNPVVPQVRDRRLLRYTLGGTGLALLIAAALWVVPWRVSRRPNRPLMQFEVELSPGGQLANVVGTDLAISPDGANLVFVEAGSQGGSKLYARRMDRREATPLAGTEGARTPFFSPDGQWVAFWADGKLKKIPASGGLPIILCDARDLAGASWGDDGNIIATLNSEARLWRIPQDGGAPTPVLDRGTKGGRLIWPQVLPGSQAILFTSADMYADRGNIEIVSLRDHRQRTVVQHGAYGRYLPSGHLVYVNQGTLYAQQFDPDRLEVHGPAVAVLPDVEYSASFGFAQFAFSQSGTLVYRRAPAGGVFTIGWLDRDGKTEPLVTEPAAYLWPRVSPDGSRVAVARTDSGFSRIWILDSKGQKQTPVTSADGFESVPTWSLDGRFLYTAGNRTLDQVPADGSGPPRTILPNGLRVPWSVSPDGKRLAYYEMSPETHFDLWTIPLEVSGGEPRGGKPEPFLRTKDVETYPTFSPDGHWMAFVAYRTGRYEVYVRAFPDNGAEVQVSRGGGRLPRWTRSGELIYATEDQRIMVASYRINGGSFEASTPRLWSEARLGDAGVLGNFDVAPDGRIVALLPPPDAATQQARNHVTFLINFFDEVERRVAAGGR
jgi:serine/threonine-protein kinase